MGSPFGRPATWMCKGEREKISSLPNQFTSSSTGHFSSPRIIFCFFLTVQWSLWIPLLFDSINKGHEELPICASNEKNGAPVMLLALNVFFTRIRHFFSSFLLCFWILSLKFLQQNLLQVRNSQTDDTNLFWCMAVNICFLITAARNVAFRCLVRAEDFCISFTGESINWIALFPPTEVPRRRDWLSWPWRNLPLAGWLGKPSWS